VTRPQPPAHLSESSRRLFRAVVRSYGLEAHHLRLLVLALEASERGEEARQAVARDGAYVMGRTGPKAHPGLAVARDASIAFARLIRELGLDIDQLAESRPPRIGGFR
jgi:phage terminase small subunit